MYCIVVRSPSIVKSSSTGADREALRRHLLSERERFVASPDAAAAAEALGAHLVDLLETLEPEVLGVYWPVRSEFNAAAALAVDKRSPRVLPFARRTPAGMEYRRWDGTTPTLRDDFGIPTSAGAVSEPDVVLVPCVGFTGDGFRLGYGGGFFDRWLAAHPSTTAVGIAWAVGAIAPGEFAPLAHDRPLTLVLTERGVVN